MHVATTHGQLKNSGLEGLGCWPLSSVLVVCAGFERKKKRTRQERFSVFLVASCVASCLISVQYFAAPLRRCVSFLKPLLSSLADTLTTTLAHYFIALCCTPSLPDRAQLQQKTCLPCLSHFRPSNVVTAPCLLLFVLLIRRSSCLSHLQKIVSNSLGSNKEHHYSSSSSFVHL